jgi:hypothetical protein
MLIMSEIICLVILVTLGGLRTQGAHVCIGCGNDFQSCMISSKCAKDGPGLMQYFCRKFIGDNLQLMNRVIYKF